MRGNVPPVPGAQQPTAEPGGLGAPATETSPRRLSPVTLAIIATTALALFLRLWQLTKHGYLLGVTEYDDGVYFGGAVRLIHGTVPYKDFITVQPPGVMLLMSPVAALAGPLGTAKALAIGRILTACAGAGGVTLTGLAIRHRGVLPVAVAGGFLAVYPDGVYAAHTVLIEPWLVLFCLAGTLAVMDGDHLAGRWQRLGAGGIAFGFAGVCKAWAVFPVLVLLAGMARTPRRALVFLGGVVAGFVLPVLPFAVLAPHAFYNQVLVAQWSRTDDVRVSLWIRLASMMGFSHGPNLPHAVLVAVVFATAAAGAGASLWATVASRRLPPALETFALFTTALVAIAFLVPNDYYYHYAAFLGPFLALAVVLPVSRLASVLRSRREAAGAAAPGGTAPGGAAPGGTARAVRERPGCCTGAAWPSRPRWCWSWPCCRDGRSPTRTTTAWRTRWWPTSGSSRPARASWPTRCPTRSRPTGSCPRCPAARTSWTPSAATTPCRTAGTASAGPVTRPPCGSSGCPPCRTRSTCGSRGSGHGGCRGPPRSPPSSTRTSG